MPTRPGVTRGWWRSAPIGVTEHLRVPIANERKDRLALVVPIVASIGHEVTAPEIDVEDVGPVTARERPDVALVASEQAPSTRLS